MIKRGLKDNYRFTKNYLNYKKWKKKDIIVLSMLTIEK